MLSVVTLTVALAGARAYYVKPHKTVNHADTLVAEPNIIYDAKLLTRFNEVMQKCNQQQDTITMRGTMTIVDKADTALKMNNVPFIMCHKANNLYYKLGQTETYNGEGVYLFIDHKAKSILISAQQPVVDNSVFKLTKGLADALNFESYQLTSQVKDSVETLTLSNEHHVSCKQYSVSYTTGELSFKRFFIRLSNPEEPLRKDNEKIIDVRINHWLKQAQINNYFSAQNVIENTGGKWKLKPKFAQYQLLQM
ncbi:hypothetical protein GCM10027037_26830 [Mucilaginibacter koreensis]